MMVFSLLFAVAGCAGPGPRLFPESPIETKDIGEGRTIQWFDLTGDGRRDFGEELASSGRIVRLIYGPDQAAADQVDLESIPAGDHKDLVLLLDSVPYHMVRDAWDQGRFRYCSPPSRQISPFPVMTDTSFSELFHVTPPGIESSYFDGKRLTNGYDVYASGGNVGWESFVDYRLNPLAHPQAYTAPYPWLSHELRRIQDLYLRSTAPITIGYCVGTSAVGAKYGRAGHLAGLAEVDRYCQWILHTTRGRARFTLLSDHGHGFYDAKRISLGKELDRLGYRNGEHLRGPRDVVVPEFGMVSCAAIHTQAPADVARDVLKVHGIDMAIYRTPQDELMVLRRSSAALITHGSAGLRYKPLQGDPLELAAILDQLRAQGHVDSNGFVHDRVLFDATVDATYPDVVYRLWRAFHGLVEHTPDVLVSTEEGYYVGSPLMSVLLRLVGVHGSLGQASSTGFVMTGTGQMPPAMRMADVRAELIKLGVAMPGGESPIGPSTHSQPTN